MWIRSRGQPQILLLEPVSRSHDDVLGMGRGYAWRMAEVMHFLYMLLLLSDRAPTMLKPHARNGEVKEEADGIIIELEKLLKK